MVATGLISQYEYYYIKGEQEEVLSLHINCINKNMLDRVVDELSIINKEHQLIIKNKLIQ